MGLPNTLSLECPYCNTKCQFEPVGKAYSCKVQKISDRELIVHRSYRCTHCEGNVVTGWLYDSYNSTSKFIKYYPSVGEWKPKVKLTCITNNEVKEDFVEAIKCYNHGFYNASMLLTRRAIQQEMNSKNAKGEKLYEQIESMGISERLKTLLHRVRIFGNHGAHPDFCLFDKDGQKIDDKEGFAKLSLDFLDKYFSNQYEIDALIENAPKSKKELDSED